MRITNSQKSNLQIAKSKKKDKHKINIQIW